MGETEVTEIKKRLITAVLLAVPVFAIIWIGDWPFMLLVSAGVWQAVREWQRATAQYMTGLPAVAIAIIVAVYWYTLATDAPVIPTIAIVCIVAVALGCYIPRKGRWAPLGLGYIAGGAIALLWLREQPYGLEYTLLLIGLVIVADSAAYVGGKTLRQYWSAKLCVATSPNKTWAGATVAILAGALFSSTLAPTVLELPWQIHTLLFAGGALVVVSIFGDLLLSRVKRSCKIRDFGSILPGHGGVLDRVDSHLLVWWVVFLHYQFFSSSPWG